MMKCISFIIIRIASKSILVNRFFLLIFPVVNTISNIVSYNGKVYMDIGLNHPDRDLLEIFFSEELANKRRLLTNCYLTW